MIPSHYRELQSSLSTREICVIFAADLILCTKSNKIIWSMLRKAIEIVIYILEDELYMYKKMPDFPFLSPLSTLC